MVTTTTTPRALSCAVLVCLALGGCGESFGEAEDTGPRTYRDRTGAITVQVPRSWDYRQTRAARDDDGRVRSTELTVGRRVRGADAQWDAPLAVLLASRQYVERFELTGQQGFVNVQDLLFQLSGDDNQIAEQCRGQVGKSLIPQLGEGEPLSKYLERNFDGLYRRAEGCGGVGSAYLDFAAVAKDGSSFVFGAIVTPRQESGEAERLITRTLRIEADRLP